MHRGRLPQILSVIIVAAAVVPLGVGYDRTEGGLSPAPWPTDTPVPTATPPTHKAFNVEVAKDGFH